MKKIIIAISLLVIVSSCGKTDETPKSTENNKPAFKIFFAEASVSHVGFMYADTVDKYLTLVSYDSGLTGSPNGIVYNRPGNSLYITENDGNRILKIKPDDTKIKLIYDSDQGVSNPTSVAIDTVSKKLYWANSGTGQIMQGTLFGGDEPVKLYDGAEVINLCYGMAIDHKNNKLYFGDNNLHQVSVGNLDGTGSPIVLYESTDDVLVCPQSIVLVGSTLYWADDCNNTIVSASADGKGPVTILFDYDNDAVNRPNGIAVDKASNKIYWSEIDGYNISRGNLDGTGTSETLLLDVQPNSISIQFK